MKESYITIPEGSPEEIIAGIPCGYCGYLYTCEAEKKTLLTESSEKTQEESFRKEK